MTPSDKRDYRPRYVQIAEAIYLLIGNGVYRAGERIPAIHELAHRFQCSQAPIRQALHLLREQGVITTVQGTGSNVASHAVLLGAGVFTHPLVRLEQIAKLVAPCPPPTDGSSCPCGRGAWPCSTTRVAWIARGQDPARETQKALRAARTTDS